MGVCLFDLGLTVEVSEGRRLISQQMDNRGHGEKSREVSQSAFHFTPARIEHTTKTHVKNIPATAALNTLVLPTLSPSLPHHPVVNALNVPIVVVIIVCNLAAPAWTAGSERQIWEGRLRGSSSPSPSSPSSSEEGKRTLKDDRDGSDEGGEGESREEGRRERERLERREVLSPEVWL